MDDANSKWRDRFLDFYFSFAFEEEELFFFIGRVLDSVRIIDVGLPFSHEEQVESTIDCKGEDETGGEDSEDRDRDKGKKFSQDSRKGHHRYEYDNSGHHSRDYRNTIFSQSEHNRRARIISDSDLRTGSLYDHDDRIDRDTERQDEREIRQKVHRISSIEQEEECREKGEREGHTGEQGVSKAYEKIHGDKYESECREGFLEEFVVVVSDIIREINPVSVPEVTIGRETKGIFYYFFCVITRIEYTRRIIFIDGESDVTKG